MTSINRSSAGSASYRQLLHLALAALAAGGVGLWLALLLMGGDASELQRDWYCLYSVGREFLATGADGLYARPCAEGYYWLYPPYVLYPYSVASLLPPAVFYGLVVVSIGLLTGFSLLVLSRLLADSVSFETIGLFIVASAAFNATIVTGQHSAILLASFVSAWWALESDRPYLAGVLLGVLGIKPNWAAFAVLWLLITRRWRVLAAMTGVGALMIATTIPLGLDVWIEYLTTTPDWIRVFLDPEAGQPAHKLITFEAFTRSTVGRLSPQAGVISWYVLEILAGIACLFVWLRARRIETELAVTVLVLVAANVYVEFYDALVLALPAAVWWRGRQRYPGKTWKLIGAAGGCVWGWQWISLYLVSDSATPSLIGGFLAIWVGAEAFRVYQETRPASIGRSGARTPPTPNPASG